MYRILGLPGAIGSMDVIHVVYGRCPKHLKHSCIGMEGVPTLAFQCVVDHNKRIMYVSQPILGGTKDKTITCNDAFPVCVALGKYHDVEYVLYNNNGIPTLCTGVYFIVDGGYPKVSYLMYPKGYPSNIEYVKWSEWVESVRKDVECTYGIRKARWRWLRSKIQTCLISHFQHQYSIGDLWSEGKTAPDRGNLCPR